MKNIKKKKIRRLTKFSKVFFFRRFIPDGRIKLSYRISRSHLLLLFFFSPIAKHRRIVSLLASSQKLMPNVSRFYI